MGSDPSRQGMPVDRTLCHCGARRHGAGHRLWPPARTACSSPTDAGSAQFRCAGNRSDMSLSRTRLPPLWSRIGRRSVHGRNSTSATTEWGTGQPIHQDHLTRPVRPNDPPADAVSAAPFDGGADGGLPDNMAITARYASPAPSCCTSTMRHCCHLRRSSRCRPETRKASHSRQPHATSQSPSRSHLRCFRSSKSSN